MNEPGSSLTVILDRLEGSVSMAVDTMPDREVAE
jgi:hypothetical protein